MLNTYAKDRLLITLARRFNARELVITRREVDAQDVAWLETPRIVKLTILVTWSGIDKDRIEPVSSR
ncbi:hypothetical protein BAE42_15850 [Mesorhizobium loti]|nr:hypothetical protein BAE42_15850 [Mesorhizobium loti]OBQ62516.1 hypothetical protein A8146_15350 [Mesorhizobium loti]